MAIKMKQVDAKAGDYLLFVDTNIWLDLYRLENNVDLTETLATISHARDRIILTSQVQMEFMKNRQKIIIDMLKTLNAIGDLKLPPIVTADQAGQDLKMAGEQMQAHRKRVAEQTNRILLDPHSHDLVFQTIEALLTEPTDLVMGRQLDRRGEVRALARKRWELGYPPRKSNDTAIGDAVNWEWVIDCELRRAGHVIIVSRDGDYGISYDRSPYLNDWLKQEYHSRLEERGKTGSISLEIHLSAALRRMAIKVPQTVVEAEARITAASSLSGRAVVTTNAGGNLS